MIIKQLKVFFFFFFNELRTDFLALYSPSSQSFSVISEQTSGAPTRPVL